LTNCILSFYRNRITGKKFDVNAETVEEFTAKVEEAAGLEAGQQSVLFRGKVLTPADNLEELGITEGDVLNVVKGRKQRKVVRSPEEVASDNALSRPSASMPGSVSMGGGGGAGAGGAGALGNMMGMPSAEQIAEMSKNPEQMEQAMQAMDQLLDGNYFEEYFADDDKLETARQQMLGSLDQYDQMMPGFKEQAAEIASSPEKWRDAMMQAKAQITNMRDQRNAMRSAKDSGAAGASEGQAPSPASASDASYSNKGVDDIAEGDDSEL